MGVAVGVGSAAQGASGRGSRVGLGCAQRMCRDIDFVQREQRHIISAPRLLAMRRMRRVGCSARFAGLHEGDPVDWSLRLTDPCPAPAAATSPNLALPVSTPGERS
jgi:hypothetical protein